MGEVKKKSIRNEPQTEQFLHELTFRWFPAAAIGEIYKGEVWMWEKNVLESIHKQNNFCINLRCGWFPAAATAESVEGDHVEKGDDDEGEVVEQA